MITEDTEASQPIWSNVITLTLSWIIWSPFQSAVWTYFQAYLKELGAAPSIIALISSVTTVAIIFARIFGGYLTDIIGRRKMIVIFTFFIAFSYYAYTWFLDWKWVLIVGVLSNIALLYQPALNAIIADSLPKKRRGFGYMITRLADIATIFAPLIAAYVLMLNNNDIIATELNLFILACISGLCAAALRAIGLKETMRPRKINQKLRNKSGRSPRLPALEITEEGINLNTAVSEFEKALILESLQKTNWVKNQAAKLLRLNRTTLVEKIKRHHLQPSQV